MAPEKEKPAPEPGACLSPDLCFQFDLFDTPGREEKKAENEEMLNGWYFPDAEKLKE